MDDQEKREVEQILQELPEDHPAWAAHKEGADAIRLTHLVDGRKVRSAWCRTAQTRAGRP